MPIPNTLPLRFTPRGLADADDATDKFPGCCKVLQNLIFDQSNPEVMTVRPGVGSPVANFSSFSSPGFISIAQVIGSRVYGMLATALTPGHDEPFCYDLAQGVFYPVSGVTAGNAEARPVSPPSTGAWTPPTMAVVGTKIIITHPGYSGGNAAFGVIDVSSANSPAYSSANTATNPLPSVPSFVANFSNRAYFACGNQVFYSDVLNPLSMTNAGQALTVGDNTTVTALAGIPLVTASGGVVQSLIVFKTSQIWQVTGDEALTNSPLSLSYLTLNVGTIAPRSVVSAPSGIYFVGPDSAYIIGLTGLVAPIAAPRSSISDIVAPFLAALMPSRIAAAYASGVYRLCINTIILGATVTNDYWFDTRRGRWTGPHTFTYDCASQYGNEFLLSQGGNLFVEKTYSDIYSNFNDNSQSYTCKLQSATFPKSGSMVMSQVVESTQEFTPIDDPSGYQIQALDEQGTQLGVLAIIIPTILTLWGEKYWGDGSNWNAFKFGVVAYALNWETPILTNKMAIEITVSAQIGVSIGTFYARVQRTGYMLEQVSS